MVASIVVIISIIISIDQVSAKLPDIIETNLKVLYLVFECGKAY